MISSHARGHPIQYINNQWVYTDTKEPIENNERPCVKCNCMPTPEGYDTCLGYLPNVVHACCGHGVEKGYINYKAKE